MLVCTVTGCVGVTACVCMAETFEPDLARAVRMSSWLRPAYGISMRKRLGKLVHSYPLSETNQRPERGVARERSPLSITKFHLLL